MKSPNVKHTCPVCRTDNFVSFPQHQADREIKELKIYCPNNASGCEWIGELNDIHKHIKDGKCCDVKCDKCDKILPSTGVKSHLDTDCPCYCPYCDVTAKGEVISSEHKEKCHKFPLPCPNDCGLDNIPQDNMDEHKKECPLEIIQCDVGCGTLMPRKDQKKHNSETFYKFFHLLLAHRNHTIQAITTATSFTTGHNCWPQLVFTYLILFIIIVIALIMVGQEVIVKDDYSSKDLKLFKHIQQNYPTLLWSIFLDKSSEQSSREYQVAPVILKLSDFSEKLKQKQRWYSSPFFVFKGGYQMYLGIRLIDSSKYDQFILRASLYVMLGLHDSTLAGDQQLLNGSFTIELLNQFNDSNHIANEVTLIHSEVCNNKCNKVSLYGRVVGRCNYPVSVPHDTLLDKNNVTYIYVRNNSLYFRISYKNVDTLQMYSYYHFIMHYLIKPSSIVVFTGIITSVLVTNFIFRIRDRNRVIVIYFTITVVLAIFIEYSIPRGITWTILHILLCNTIFKVLKIGERARDKSLQAILLSTLVLGGCLVEVLIDILLYTYTICSENIDIVIIVAT